MHVLHRSFSLLNEVILFRVSLLNEAILFRALPYLADDFSRARLRFSTRRRQLPIASHPRKPLRSYAHPPGLRYPHATHCIFQFPSIILLVPYVYAALQLR